MKEISPGIFLIKEKGSIKLRKPPVNIYIIAGEQDGLIFDAGYGDKKTIKYVIEEIEKIKALYASQNKNFKLTKVLSSHMHPDHFAGLYLLRKHLGINGYNLIKEFSYENVETKLINSIKELEV